MLCLAGCFSLDTAPVRATGEEHVLVHNFGWRLFNCIPVVCGNADPDASCGCAFFRDDVTIEKVQAHLAAHAGGREIRCPVYHNSDSVFFNIVGIPFPIPYVICYKEVSVSATLPGRSAK